MTRINVVEPSELSGKHLVVSLTREDVVAALEKHDYYIATTARSLGISRGKLYTLIQKFEIVFKHKIGVQRQNKYDIDKVNNIYYKMINRCTNPEASDYEYYGGRGIGVCPEWLSSRDAFTEYVMTLENFNTDGYSLDRIDNYGNYEPGNVKFSTRKEQANNTRRNIVVQYNGKSMTLIEFCDTYGKNLNLSYALLQDRLKLGFSFEEALILPKNAKRKTYFKRNQPSTN